VTTAKEDSTAADAAPKGTTPGAAMDSVVHLVDEDPGARDRLDRLMRRAYLPCRGYRDSDDLLLRLNDDRPGCVLVTLRTPGMAGVRTQQRLSDTGSTLSVVFLGDSPRVSAAVGAMRAGAEDFLDSPTDDDTLIDTVQQAVARDRRRKARQSARLALRERLARLTPRERETLEAVVSGLSNKGIAEALSISPKTVELHRAHMMHKMGAGSVAEVVKLYLFATEAATPPVTGFPLPGHGERPIGNRQRTD
jgi:FixJ family two-component response regulator|tara:strand:+ start:3479 stop:4228 length:750 start_codon:yes stop_codon:yes gene_type:complete